MVKLSQTICVAIDYVSDRVLFFPDSNIDILFTFQIQPSKKQNVVKLQMYVANIKSHVLERKLSAFITFQITNLASKT